VDQRFQGRGLGAALLADAATRTLKADAAAFMLLVDARDVRAVAFYQRFGFRVLTSEPRTLFLPLATAQKVFLEKMLSTNTRTTRGFDTIQRRKRAAPVRGLSTTLCYASVVS
jgi:predicted N-acetyltransferase YhbS